MTLPLRLDVSEAAKRDMRALLAYIGEENPKAAIHVAKQIVAKMQMLVTQPAPGRPGRCKGTRELIVEHTPYIVAYRVNTDERRILVLRIVHHAQRWPEKL
jgi:toxin ParE1/3/4